MNHLTSEMEGRISKSAHFIGQRGRNCPEIRISLHCRHVIWYLVTRHSYPAQQRQQYSANTRANRTAAAQHQHSIRSTSGTSSSISVSQPDISEGSTPKAPGRSGDWGGTNTASTFDTHSAAAIKATWEQKHRYQQQEEWQQVQWHLRQQTSQSRAADHSNRQSNRAAC